MNNSNMLLRVTSLFCESQGANNYLIFNFSKGEYVEVLSSVDVDSALSTYANVLSKMDSNHEFYEVGIVNFEDFEMHKVVRKIEYKVQKL